MLLEALTGNLTFKSLPPCDLNNTTKEEIRAYFINSYELNESLFVSLKDESVLLCSPDRLRLPLIFYYAHTAVVYMNKLILAGLCQPEERVDMEFEALFETGVDEQSWDDTVLNSKRSLAVLGRASDHNCSCAPFIEMLHPLETLCSVINTENFRLGGEFKWPNLKQVVAYRQSVKDLILDVIDRSCFTLPITKDSLWWALFMGMEHERIHLETSSVLIRQLPVDMVEIPPGWSYGPLNASQAGGDNPFISIKETRTVELGKPNNFPSYGWDNEYGLWRTEVPPFKATKHMISNGEFLRFVESGGYKHREFWTREGWGWKEFREAAHPTFWVCHEGCKSGCGGSLASYTHCQEADVKINGSKPNYRFRLMFDVVDLPVSWPAEVNYHEAKAYCNWLGPQYRLPVEAEHNVIRGQLPSLTEGVSSDIAYDVKCQANLHLQFGSSTPVDLYPENDAGFTDTFGNVWEYVEDHFNGFPGATTHPHYDDYSSPTFDGKHATLVGGSWISTGTSEASRFGRYGFRHHFYQHAGFRVCCSLRKDSFLPIRLVTSNAGMNSRNPEASDVCLPTRDLRPGFIPSGSKQIRDDNENTVNRLIGEELDVKEEYNFSVLCADVTKELLRAKRAQRASSRIGNLLMIGVGAGRTVRELSGEKFDSVLAIDALGSLVKEASDRYAELKTDRSDAVDVVFKQLTWIPNEVQHVDTVLFTSMESKANAEAWLLRIPEIVLKGGLAIMISAKGLWDAEKIGKAFNGRLLLASCKSLLWRSIDSQEYEASLTVWSKE